MPENQLMTKYELLIPNQFQKYKYVIILSKSSSSRYPVILDIVQKCEYLDISIDKVNWHVVGIENTIEGLKKYVMLQDLTDGLKNVFFFKDGMLVSRDYRLKELVDCAMRASLLPNPQLYCFETRIVDKNKLDNPFMVPIKNLDIFDSKLNFKTINFVKQKFPCHHVNNNLFNPYEYDQNEISLQHAYYTYMLRKKHIVTDCPFFNHLNYTCEFLEEIIPYS